MIRQCYGEDLHPSPHGKDAWNDHEAHLDVYRDDDDDEIMHHHPWKKMQTKTYQVELPPYEDHISLGVSIDCGTFASEISLRPSREYRETVDQIPNTSQETTVCRIIDFMSRGIQIRMIKTHTHTREIYKKKSKRERNRIERRSG